MRILTQSGAISVMIFMFNPADGFTGVAGLTLAIQISKNGAAFASISPTVTEVGAGWYKVSLSATDTNTVGELVVKATAAGAAGRDEKYEVSDTTDYTIVDILNHPVYGLSVVHTVVLNNQLALYNPAYGLVGPIKAKTDKLLFDNANFVKSVDQNPTVTILPYQGSVQASYAKEGSAVTIVQSDSVSIPYDLATSLTGWTVKFAAKKYKTDTTYAIPVKDITADVVDAAAGTGMIPLTTANTGISPDNYHAEIQIAKDAQVVTAMKFILIVKEQIIV